MYDGKRWTDPRRGAPVLGVLALVLLLGLAYLYAPASAQETADDKVERVPASVFDIPEDDEELGPPGPPSSPDDPIEMEPEPAEPDDEPERSTEPDSEPAPEPEPEPAAPEREPRAGRAFIPAEPEQARAERAVREVFAKELAGKRAGQKSALAKRLLAEAPAEQDLAVRYVLLREARDAAAAGGDAGRVVEAVRQLTESFRLRGRPMLLDSLISAGKADVSPPELRSTALALLDLAGSDDLTYALTAATAAEATARRSKDARLMARAKLKVAEVTALGREFPWVRTATATLESNPEDAAACLEVGRYLCFARGRWARGLPLLAAGSDPVLARLAKRELARRPSGPEGHRELADAWWDAAGEFKEPVKGDARARACYWYGKLHPQLSGIARVTAEKRMTEALAARLRPGLVGRFFANHSYQRGGPERVDKTISFNWGTGAPAAGIPADNFGATWRGYIKAPSAGKYKIVTHNDDGVRVWIDETLVIDQWHCLQAPVYTADVELSGAPQTIMIDYPECGGAAGLRLSWVPPGATKAKQVPATALFHQPAGRGYVVRPRPEATASHGGHTYALVSKGMSWTAARQWCREMGGDLPVIESATEQDFLAGLVAGTIHPWIGLSDEDESGVFRWIDGTLPRYTAWAGEGHPNADPQGGPGGAPEDYVVLWQGGRWADVDWGFTGFLCEWDD